MAWCCWVLLSILDQCGATSCPGTPHIRSSSVPLRRQHHFPVLISISHQSIKPFFGQVGGQILYKNAWISSFFARAIEGFYPELSLFYTANVKAWWYTSFSRLVPKCSGGCYSPNLFKIHSFNCNSMTCWLEK